MVSWNWAKYSWAFGWPAWQSNFFPKKTKGGAGPVAGGSRAKVTVWARVHFSEFWAGFDSLREKRLLFKFALGRINPETPNIREFKGNAS